MLQALTHLKKIIALKSEVNELHINTIIIVPTSLNNLKTKIDDIYVGELEIVPVDLKKIDDVVDNKVVKNTKFLHWHNHVNSHKSMQHR